MLRYYIQLSFLAVALLSVYPVLGQGKLVFKKTEHEFGDIEEEAGVAEVTFEFTNTGNAPIKVTYVKASCGCTTPTWSQEPIAPGKQGFIKAAYNPRNRPGKFNKSIQVRTDGTPNQMVLYLRGNVIPRPKGVQDFFPVEAGNLRFKSTSIYYPTVFHDGTAEQELAFYNQGAQAIEVDFANSNLPKHLTVAQAKVTVNPKDSAKVKITYDAVKRNDWGFVSDNFMLKTNDPNTPNKRLYVSARIRENFGNITNDTPLPVFNVDKRNHNFGKINQKTRNTAVFTISNNGNAPLIIRKTKASCGCTVSQPKKTELAPGESTSLDVTYSSGTKQGQQRQNVTLVTNDPSNQEIRLTIEAEVLVEGASVNPEK